MPATTRSRDKEIDHLAESPQTGNTRVESIKSKYRTRAKVPATNSSQDTDETLDNSPGCPHVRAVPEALPKPFENAATRKHDRELDDAGCEMAERAKKPRMDTASRDSLRDHLSAVQHIFDRKDQEARDAAEREIVIVEEADRAQRELAKQEEEITRLQTNLEKSKNAKANQRKKLQEERMLEKELKELKSQHARLQSRNQELESEIQEKSDSLEFLEEELSQALEEIKPDRGDPDKVTDDEINARWGSISFTIEQLATVCTQSHIQGLEVSVDHTSLNQLIRNCQRSQPLSNSLIQRFIWQRLCSEVFEAKSGLWGGRIGELFIDMIAKMRDLEKGNEMNLSLVSRMKYKTAKDIDRDLGLDSEILQKLATTLFDDLSRFVPASQRQKIRDETLPTLFDEAAELMVIITRSRAIFTIDVNCLYQQRPFDPNVMNSHYHLFDPRIEEEGLGVYLLMSPSLEKIGVADGARFGSHQVLRKANAATYGNA
ncbi:hypothetical protein G6O67_007198 [Ophiocordyceps sinensis]|uniref:Uncharacterized protein n=2 Tax=Ophiocordyceps sinensis TaxID=72228 RepID=A0A8H4PLA8_9HYPO|nr:hypothetical protein OCS_04212 [Ophiocordyceps sinensis CO18]KAF4505226.1 hypothetical protein G6O67_007198 [Ophiocordyceps sinensis]